MFLKFNVKESNSGVSTDMKNSIVNLHCLLRIEIIISTVSNFNHWYINVLSTRPVSKARKISITIKYSIFFIFHYFIFYIMIRWFFPLWRRIICPPRVLSTKFAKRNNIITAFKHCKFDYIISQIDGALYMYIYRAFERVAHA